MKLDIKSIAMPTAVLLIICVVVSAALAGTNLLTKDKIQEQQLQNAEKSRRIVLNTAEEFSAEKEGLYYTGTAGGQTVGYVFETQSKGYGGTVKVMTGMDAEGKITGVVILSHSETPGLGANAEKPAFLDQFQQSAPENGIDVVKFQAPKEGEIEAMTGATITSKAVADAVNAAIVLYQQEVEK